MCDHKVGTCVGTKRLPLQLHVKITTNFALGRILLEDYNKTIGKKPGQFVRILLVTCCTCTLRSTFAARIRILLVPCCTLRKTSLRTSNEWIFTCERVKTNGSHFKTNGYTAFNTAKR
jgi:hypothetical protein